MSDGAVAAGLAVGALLGGVAALACLSAFVISPMEDRCRQREVDRCLKAHVDNVPAFRVCESKAKEWCSR